MARAFLCVSLYCASLCMAAQPFEAQAPCLREMGVHKSARYDPTPYILPLHHFLRSGLDSIFVTAYVIKNAKTFAHAGFITLTAQKTSGIRVARHPKMPGYIVKLYLASQKTHRSKMSQQDWLVQRCRGASQLRKLIRKKQIQFFTVPEKWLYELPRSLSAPKKRTFIVVETYMHLVSRKKTFCALKQKITKQHLRELLLLEKCGGAAGPGAFHLNAPYTQEGKFAFIDTEYPDRVFSPSKTKKIGRYFSSSMRKCWIRLVDEKM